MLGWESGLGNFGRPRCTSGPDGNKEATWTDEIGSYEGSWPGKHHCLAGPMTRYDWAVDVEVHARLLRILDLGEGMSATIDVW